MSVILREHLEILVREDEVLVAAVVEVNWSILSRVEVLSHLRNHMLILLLSYVTLQLVMLLLQLQLLLLKY